MDQPPTPGPGSPVDRTSTSPIDSPNGGTNSGTNGSPIGNPNATPNDNPDPPAAPADTDGHPLQHLRMPVDVRNVAMAVLAVLASIYTLHWASAVFIPLLLGVMASYALSPAVDRLQRWRVPRALGAGLLMLSALGSLGWIGYALADDAAALVESLPAAAQKLRETLRDSRAVSEGPIDKVQRAATSLEQAAEENAAPAAAPTRGVARVQIERPRFNIKDYLWSGTLGLVGLIGQALVVVFITFFLLAAGDGFRRKLVRVTGPTFSRRKLTVQTLDEITGQIQRYLAVQVYTSVLVGIATWLALLAVGLERAAVWGVAAALLNLVPYIGSLVLTAGLVLVGFVQFGQTSTALWLGGLSLAIHTVSGQLLTPWMTGRASRMDPVVIFVGVLAFGWLWGVWGLLLGAPVLMVVKAVCDRVEELQAVGELLGD